MSRMVASPSTMGGISDEISMMPNAATHIQVIASVTDLKPSLRAVASSTESSAYSRTNGCPISTPTSAIRNSPALLSGCSQRSNTSVGTVKAATVSTANTARLPISRLCAFLAQPVQHLDEHRDGERDAHRERERSVPDQHPVDDPRHEPQHDGHDAPSCSAQFALRLTAAARCGDDLVSVQVMPGSADLLRGSAGARREWGGVDQQPPDPAKPSVSGGAEQGGRGDSDRTPRKGSDLARDALAAARESNAARRKAAGRTPLHRRCAANNLEAPADGRARPRRQDPQPLSATLRTWVANAGRRRRT